MLIKLDFKQKNIWDKVGFSTLKWLIVIFNVLWGYISLGYIHNVSIHLKVWGDKILTLKISKKLNF